MFNLKTILTFSIFILLGLLFIASVYNLDVVLGILNRFFSVKLVKYLIFFIYGYSSIKVAVGRLPNHNNILAFIFVLLPFLVVDINAIVKDMNYFPLRFPLVTLFPVAGALLALVKRKGNKIQLYVISIFSLVYICLFYFFLNPFFIYQLFQVKVNDLAAEESISVNGEFKTIDANYIQIADTINAPNIIISCFFVGCSPCEELKKSISIIADKAGANKLGYVFICDGSITDFEKFTKYAKSYRDKRFVFLFDDKGILKKRLGNVGYPYEMFLSNYKVKDRINGFDKEIGSYYIKKRLSLLK